MANANTLKKTWLTAFFMVLLLAGSGSANAQAGQPKLDASAPTIQITASDANSRFVPLGIGKSVVIDLPRDVKDVLVADPKTANAVIRTSRRAYIIGVKVGQTSVVFFDAEGKQIAGLDVAVTRDLNGVRTALRHIFPDGDIRIEGVGDGVVLTGASIAERSTEAYDIASGLSAQDSVKVAQGSRVVIRSPSRPRSGLLRSPLRRSSAMLSNSSGSIWLAVSARIVGRQLQHHQSVLAYGSILAYEHYRNFTHQLTTTVMRAMERAGIIRTLAEPNLDRYFRRDCDLSRRRRVSIPDGLCCDTTRVPPICQQSIEYKKFGVSLHFTPVVLAEGRISMKVMTEASDLSNENAITLRCRAPARPDHSLDPRPSCRYDA